MFSFLPARVAICAQGYYVLGISECFQSFSHSPSSPVGLVGALIVEVALGVSDAKLGAPGRRAFAGLRSGLVRTPFSAAGLWRR